MNENQDILDLCKLNIMEENIEGVTETGTGSIQEVQSFKDAIVMAKKKVVNRIFKSQQDMKET